MLTLADIREAERRVAPHIHRTPLLSATLLGRDAGLRLSLKCENLQKTGSFKVRGTLNKLATLSDEERRRGVVAVSAGNHAQALAWAARQAGIPCTVVMPAHASRAKAEASRGYGAEVILHGTTFDAFALARSIAAERGMTFVHPFEDPLVAAGAGTVGLEIIEQMKEAGTLAALAAVVVGIGGGGLAGGVALAIKSLCPAVKVYGVEPAGASSMRRSLDAGHAVKLERVEAGLADGLGAPEAGELTHALARDYLDDVVLVDDAAIADAMRRTLLYTKLLAEGAGAAAIAAVLGGKIPVAAGAQVCCILSGGNVDPERLREVL